MDYNSSNDNLGARGYISKAKILDYVSQEDIFSLVFGFKPVEFEYVKSPFREDDSPGCWFEYYNGKLLFKDFGNQSRVGKIKMTFIDCFDAVQVRYNLSNYYQTLAFIKKHLIEGKNLPLREHKLQQKSSKKEAVQVLIKARTFDKRDKEFWSKYSISRQNLIDDKVFPTIAVKLLNSKNGDTSFATRDISYAFTDFNFGRKKVYRPNQKGGSRFISNCKADDIGNINQLKPYGKQLIITKSYKDCRVLRNHGLNSVWFQNEGMRPSIKSTIDLCKRFEEVIIFYDNDEAGIKASNKISNEINIMLPNKSRGLYLPTSLNTEGVSDSSDYVVHSGHNALRQFLTNNNIKYE